jgi:hypothetical protein
MYCNGILKDVANARVSIEYTIKFEAVHYRGVEWVFKETPDLCGA